MRVLRVCVCVEGRSFPNENGVCLPCLCASRSSIRGGRCAPLVQSFLRSPSVNPRTSPTPFLNSRVADYIVLNKIDLLDTATVESLTAIMASLNPLAQARRNAGRGEGRN